MTAINSAVGERRLGLEHLFPVFIFSNFISTSCRRYITPYLIINSQSRKTSDARNILDIIFNKM